MKNITKAKAIFLAFTLAATALLAACGNKPAASTGTATPNSGETNQNQTSEGELPRKGLELTVYGSCDEIHVASACEAFEKATGVRTTFVRMSTGEVFARLKEESGNPQAGIWYGGPNDPYMQAKAEGLLEAYEAKNTVNLLEDKFRDPEGYWYGIYTGYVGFLCNEALLKEKNLPVPTSWAELTDPMYANCIAYANPGASGTGYNLVSSIIQIMGEEDGMKYLAALDKNIRQYAKNGGGPGKLVGSGELEIAIGMLHDGITQRNLGYDDVVMSSPKEGTGYEIGAMAIIKGTKQLEAAKLWIEWGLTPEAQEIGQAVGAYQFLTVKGAKNPPEADVFKDTVLIDYDFAWSAENRERIVDEWNKIVTGDKIQTG